MVKNTIGPVIVTKNGKPVSARATNPKCLIVFDPKLGESNV
jgi:hypothetical protein